MKYGVFYNPMVPKALGQSEWEPGQERQALTDMIEQIRFPDTLGFECAFLGEHRCMPEHAPSSATEVDFGALSHSATQIRIGTRIITPRMTTRPNSRGIATPARAVPTPPRRCRSTCSTRAACGRARTTSSSAPKATSCQCRCRHAVRRDGRLEVESRG